MAAVVLGSRVGCDGQYWHVEGGTHTHCPQFTKPAGQAEQYWHVSGGTQMQVPQFTKPAGHQAAGGSTAPARRAGAAAAESTMTQATLVRIQALIATRI